MEEHSGAGSVEPTVEEIARRAYELSLSRDGGTSEANWLRAEQELRAWQRQRDEPSAA